MKTFKQSFVLLAIFLALGETIVRIDKKFLFFQGSRFVEVAVETRRSPEPPRRGAPPDLRQSDDGSALSERVRFELGFE